MPISIEPVPPGAIVVEGVKRTWSLLLDVVSPSKSELDQTYTLLAGKLSCWIVMLGALTIERPV